MKDLDEFLYENLGYGNDHDSFVLDYQDLVRYKTTRAREVAREFRANKPKKPKQVSPLKFSPNHRALKTVGSKGKWVRFNGEWIKL